MSGRKRRRLDSTVAAIQQRYGAQALQRGARTLRPARGPHISTGFPTLDAVTGCDGVPGNAMTLLCGQSTSGKLTVAYKTLAAAQQHGRGGQVAIVDLAHHSDPDYLARCGIDLERLLLVRHHAGLDVPALLVDLVRTREVRLILLDNVGKEWFGCYGSEEHCTPNIDRLAAEGVRFSHCYTTTVCAPSVNRVPPWR